MSLHRNFELLLTQIFCRRLNLEQGIVSLEVDLSTTYWDSSLVLRFVFILFRDDYTGVILSWAFFPHIFLGVCLCFFLTFFLRLFFKIFFRKFFYLLIFWLKVLSMCWAARARALHWHWHLTLFIYCPNVLTLTLVLSESQHIFLLFSTPNYTGDKKVFICYDLWFDLEFCLTLFIYCSNVLALTLSIEWEPAFFLTIF